MDVAITIRTGIIMTVRCTCRLPLGGLQTGAGTGNRKETEAKAAPAASELVEEGLE
jgi:hypothetical protein